MTACIVTDEGLVMGAGDIVADAVTVTSWVDDGGWSRDVVRKNVQVAVGTLGTYSTRIMADGGTTLTLKDACPFPTAS